MRAWIFSDLHIDVNAKSQWLMPEPRPEHDIVIIAGDICQGLERGVRWIAEHGLNEKPVIYVPGNHEYYGFDFDNERDVGQATAGSLANIYVLDRDAVVIDGTAFLGATLCAGAFRAVTAHRLPAQAPHGNRTARFPPNPHP